MSQQQERNSGETAKESTLEHDTGPANQSTTGGTHDKNSGGVAAVDRALSILQAFRAGGSSLSLTEIARRTGFNKSTRLRLNQSLERFEYLVRGATGGIESGRQRGA